MPAATGQAGELSRTCRLGLLIGLLSSPGPAAALPVPCQGPDPLAADQICNLSAGAAQLQGEAGQLITLRFSDGQAVQAFCPNLRGEPPRCRVRQPSAGEPSPNWLDGLLQLSDPPPGQPPAGSSATVLIQQQAAGEAPQRLGRFELPWPLVLQALSLTSPPVP